MYFDVLATFDQKEPPMTKEPTAPRLADLVEYQSNAVVSKTLIEKKTGTVTLFAFDKGQGLSEHTAPFDAMVCVLDGTVETHHRADGRNDNYAGPRTSRAQGRRTI